MTITTFFGPATPLTAADITGAARRLGCEPAAIRAVIEVESSGSGGFLLDTRPKILFEAKHFHDATRGRFDAFSSISSPFWNRSLYLGGAGEYARLEEAMKLDPDAALASASWGMFQIMGSNWRDAGAGSLDGFIVAMVESEGEHLRAFTGLIERWGIAGTLAQHEWAAFARRYNGPGYAANAYDIRLAAAYRKARGLSAYGDAGPAVMAAQRALCARGASLIADGDFGPATQRAVADFQSQRNLPISQEVDVVTAAALGLEVVS